MRGWRSQLIFFLSGSIFVFNQQESYWGANDPRSMLNGVSQYAGMSVFALVWAALTRRRSPLLALRASKLRAAQEKWRSVGKANAQALFDKLLSGD